MFDVLTYQKGGALLRMLEQYLGDERFRDGRQPLPRPHAYGNTETNDLWDAIEETTRRAGAAHDGLVDLAARLPARHRRRSTASELVLRQQRFALRREVDRRRHARGSCRCTSATATDVDTRAARRATRRALTLADPSAPVVVNAGGHGFFRVAYSDELRGRLDRRRARLARHARALQPRRRRVERGRRRPPRRRPTSSTFVEGFADERELAVWQAIVIGLRGLGRLLDDDATSRAFQQRVARARRAGASPTSAIRSTDEDDLRRQAPRAARPARSPCSGDDAATQAACRELYDRPRGRPGSVDPGAGRRGHVGRRRHRRRGRLRADARPASARRDAAGPAAPPVRARRVRRRRAARAADVRAAR